MWFSKKPCLESKQGFFWLRRSLVCNTKKPCLQTVWIAVARKSLEKGWFLRFYIYLCRMSEDGCCGLAAPIQAVFLTGAGVWLYGFVWRLHLNENISLPFFSLKVIVRVRQTACVGRCDENENNRKEIPSRLRNSGDSTGLSAVRLSFCCRRPPTCRRK